MTAKICLITGANRGIGKATALALARMGARVVMVCRNPSLGEAARDEIIAASGSEAVDLLIADLASQAAVRGLARAFAERYDALHVLVNNAGVILKDRSVTPDGLETTFAVNHLAPFLLTDLLLDLLKAGAPSRIVNVSSIAHRWANIDFDDLGGEKQYSMGRAYYQSKLANVLFTYELARQLDGMEVTTNALEPGIVATDIFRERTGFRRLLTALYHPFMLSSEQGAETVIYLAASPEVEGVTGRYFKKKADVKSSKRSCDSALARRLWEVSAELTGLDS